MSPNIDYGEHGRCEATAKSTGERCGRPAVGDHGKCDIHGGDSPKGEDSPSFKHGLFSDHLNEQDREAVAALEDLDNTEKLEELINWRLARLRRYLRQKNDAERESFFDKFDAMVREGRKNGEPGLSAKQIKELAKALSMNNRAAQEEIDLVRKLIKAHDKIAGDGGGVGGLRDLFGGDGE
ncbi:hypothetical protein [Haloarcula sp. K1]|uniref:hypothetical protein n=1 Tax=Haloarcula sp. K1 TaxID=1622207 RepID=UPI0007BC211E|nr:hypothetical protein [Haloarcula sp. K1]KZX49287.1 hypothetical protein AV929_12140 [Haloarcula sp. K1]